MQNGDRIYGQIIETASNGGSHCLTDRVSVEVI